ncbi:hypothetical protein [Brevibacterium oceani]|uniref:hypothetical protein n=1 Tax=Brevibacterium oceani TaxID=358099 RepID=UPI001B335868|nr:hypothetical protein [Brevibacterium oceani]
MDEAVASAEYPQLLVVLVIAEWLYLDGSSPGTRPQHVRCTEDGSTCTEATPTRATLTDARQPRSSRLAV